MTFCILPQIAVVFGRAQTGEQGVGSDLTNIVVVSDAHLHAGDVNHPNQKTFDNFLKYLSLNPQVTDVIFNGDIYHHPTVFELPRHERIQLVVKAMQRMQSVTRATIHFNFGNHDVEYLPSPSVNGIEESYSLALKAALENAGIRVIGTDFTAVYDYPLKDLRFKISHFPFAKTDAMFEQADRLRFNPRAHAKVTNVSTNATTNDGSIRIMSDSHTPLEDRNLSVFNTGKLAFTFDLPHEENTFLRFSSNGKGELLKIRPDGSIARFRAGAMCVQLIY